MQPTRLDLKVIRLLTPLQARPALVDAIDILSRNSLVNGFVFVVPLYLYWHFSEGERRRLAQRRLLIILLGMILGALASLLLQQLIRWPPPAVHPAVADVYSPLFRDNPNLNSFPSDSTLLFSTVAFGVAAWSSRLSMGLLTWLLVFVAPSKVFVGGHYPTDLLAGLLLGFCSVRLSSYLMDKLPRLENLASNQSVVFRLAIFFWLFEVGNELRDLRDIWHGAVHIPRHLGWLVAAVSQISA